MEKKGLIVKVVLVLLNALITALPFIAPNPAL
jgi:hypothetical protein